MKHEKDLRHFKGSNESINTCQGRGVTSKWEEEVRTQARFEQRLYWTTGEVKVLHRTYKDRMPSSHSGDVYYLPTTGLAAKRRGLWASGIPVGYYCRDM